MITDYKKNILIVDFDNLITVYNRLKETEGILLGMIKENLEAHKVNLYEKQDDKLGFNIPSHINNGDVIYPEFRSKYEFDCAYIHPVVFYEVIDDCVHIFKNIYNFDLITSKKNDSICYHLSNNGKYPTSIILDAKHDDNDNSCIDIIVSYCGIDMIYSGDSHEITFYAISSFKGKPKSNNTMPFSDAYKKMVEGHKITRPGFNGYWYIDSNSGKVTIYTNNKEFSSDDISVTIHNIIQNTAATDWIVVE